MGKVHKFSQLTTGDSNEREAEAFEDIARGFGKLAEARRVAAACGRRSDGIDEYTTRSLPPDIKGRARFNTLAPGIPGARKLGRTWIVPRAAWEAARAPKRKCATVTPPSSDIDLADAALAAAGLRSTRRLA